MSGHDPAGSDMRRRTGINSSVNMKTGTQLFACPGPTNYPSDVLQALAHEASDLGDPDLVAAFTRSQRRLKQLVGTDEALLMYTSSRHGAWHAALTNLFSPGDCVVFIHSGFHAQAWYESAGELGLEARLLGTAPRTEFDPQGLADLLRTDLGHCIKAVCLVHNEAATGVVQDLSTVRNLLDEYGHPALYLVDAVSSMGCMPINAARFGVDVLPGTGQKGLMLPVGMGFNTVSDKAMQAHRRAGFTKGWSIPGQLSLYCQSRTHASNSVSAMYLHEQQGVRALKSLVRRHFDVVVATGLGELEGCSFRIRHMGDFNASMVFSVIASVEAGMALLGIKFRKGAAQIAVDRFTAEAQAAGIQEEAAGC
ncbi:alanine--glyoxylate aminotransferase family protein [Verticiella sediminum]|uniref:Alanine--glyoxylate aminotransferase family protein n=2 Tax=Verticiella sediminum TaxID=1247510 RepID=A0A556AQ04_9BURK|nr:alanine--glyoxylate aminotransferase family protein [Verticiella sediminum]